MSRHVTRMLLALAGEFHVASELCLRGYFASLTLKNYPGVDIFAKNPVTGKERSVQVKTARSNDFFVPRDAGEGDKVFVFVHVDKDNKLTTYIVPGEKVNEIAQGQTDRFLERSRIKGRNPKPDQPHMVSVHNIQDYRNRWDLLGLDDTSRGATQISE